MASGSENPAGTKRRIVVSNSRHVEVSPPPRDSSTMSGQLVVVDQRFPLGLALPIVWAACRFSLSIPKSNFVATNPEPGNLGWQCTEFVSRFVALEGHRPR